MPKDGTEIDPLNANVLPERRPGMDYRERAEQLADETTLSRRESEVMALKEEGRSHAEIAEELGLAKSTVDEYSRRINDRIQRARATVDELGEDS